MGGRISQQDLEAAAILREQIDGLIEDHALAKKYHYDIIYTMLGFGDPPCGREPNLYNIFSHVKRMEWIRNGEKFGKDFNKLVTAAYNEAIDGLDHNGLKKLRVDLMAKSKLYNDDAPGAEARSMKYVKKVLEKAVCALFCIDYISCLIYCSAQANRIPPTPFHLAGCNGCHNQQFTECPAFGLYFDNGPYCCSIIVNTSFQPQLSLLMAKEISLVCPLNAIVTL